MTALQDPYELKVRADDLAKPPTKREQQQLQKAWKKWADVMRGNGINVDQLEDAISRAYGIVTTPGILRVIHLREQSFTRFNEDNVLASIYAARAAWEAANGLHSAIENAKTIKDGRTIAEVRSRPRRQWLQELIDKQVARRPDATVDELWATRSEDVTIGIDAFTKRVTQARKKLGASK